MVKRVKFKHSVGSVISFLAVVPLVPLGTYLGDDVVVVHRGQFGLCEDVGHLLSEFPAGTIEEDDEACSTVVLLLPSFAKV